MDRADVLIIGGGAIGSAAALFLRRAAQAPSVMVVEPDPTYALASTPRATGGVRRLFSCPENILMSQASLDFFTRFRENVEVGGEAPDLSTARAFIASATQGVSYRPGVWHHPMIALDAPIDFTCLVWEDGTDGDCVVSPLPQGALTVASV